jgi:TRAP-type mannitol/chloroaromatic compound transport system permease small subunit
VNGPDRRGKAERLVAGIEWIIEWAGRIAAWVSLLLVLVVAYDVLARYGLGGASVAMQEFEWHLVPPIALIGMAYAMRHREHVRVDFIYSALPPRGQAFIDLFGAILTLVVSVIFIKLSLPFVQESYRLHEGSPDPGGLPDRWILKAFIPLGFSLLAIQSVAMCIEYWLKMLRGPRDE